MKLTAVYIAVPEGYIAFVEELPGANTQGDTLDEARENLREAVELVLEANRELAEKSLAGQSVTREPFVLGAPEKDMLRDLTKGDWLSILGISPEMVPQALLVRGTRNLKTRYTFHRRFFSEVLEIGTPNGLVEDVLIGTVDGVRVGYASVYGGAMASEIVHIFGVLGTPLVVQVGCCGALAHGFGPGDLLLVEEAYCGDGASQYYKTDGKTVRAKPFPAALVLPERAAGIPVRTGRIFTTAALFAEGRREIEDWHSQGFAGVDMETAATFAVAEHFGMDRVALLFAFDNPRDSGHLLLHETDKSERRARGDERMTELAFEIIRHRVASKRV